MKTLPPNQSKGTKAAQPFPQTLSHLTLIGSIAGVIALARAVSAKAQAVDTVDSGGNLYVGEGYNGAVRVARPTGYLHFETESLTIREKSGAVYRIIADSSASAGGFSLLNANASGEFVTYTVPISAAGTYGVQVGIKTGDDGGRFQLVIDGVTQGSAQEEYSLASDYELRDLGAVTFSTPGNKAFQFSLTGRDPRSRGYTLGLDYIDMQPIAKSELAQTGSLIQPANQTDTHTGTA